MAKQPPIRVALDLETTGLHAEQDVILEVAAIRFQGTTILEKMETFVAPGRSIPYRVQRLTGITPLHVANAPRFEDIAGQLQRLIGNYPIVGHSIPFDVGFLRRHGLGRTNPMIDTFEMASVLLPSLPSYNLGQVARSLGIPVAPGRHRAMVDTLLAMEVFLALHERLQAVDLATLQDLANLDAPRSWPLLSFFRQEWRERSSQDDFYRGPARGSLGDRFAAQLGMDPRVLSFAIARQDETQVHDGSSTRAVRSPLTTVAAAASTSPVAVSTTKDMETLVEVIAEEMPSSGSSAAPTRNDAIETGDAGALENTPTSHLHRHVGYQTAYRAVRQTLEDHSCLLTEVTVGANDYTPLLLPALEWLSEAPVGGSNAHMLPRRLIIACASPQVARRLVDEVLPRLQEALKSHVPVAYLAEKGGYLCLHRWFGSALRRTSGELSAEQARGMAKLALWAQQTHTGERCELTMLPQEISAWERICSGVEQVPLAGGSETPYQRCLYRRKGYCFAALAEERARTAGIVVTTHAGLLDDLSSPRSLLKSIDRRVILDADLLEEEVARWSGAELDHARLLGILHTIGAELPNGRYQGLLALAAPALRENGPGGLSSTPTIAKSELDTRMLAWFQTLRQACTAVDNLFTALGQLLHEGINGGNARDKGKREGAGRSHGGGGRSAEQRVDQPLRLTGQTRNMPSWMEVEQAWRQTAQRLQTVVGLLHEAERIMLATRRRHNRLDLGSGEDDSVAWELVAIAQRLEEQKNLGQQVFGASASGANNTENDHERVYWLRMPSVPPLFAQQRQVEVVAPPLTATLSTEHAETSPVFYTQVVQTTALLKQQVLPPNVSAILAGVALSVDSHFSFYRNRFGLDADSCPALSIVTEHHEQTLLYLPEDVPEPNMPRYQQHLDEAIAQLATMLDGQLVVLFTSYAALRSSYATVKPLLEARGILALGHGIDGSPRQLWQMFQDQERVILLGTGSFWDGVEEVSRPPACVLVTRLPMPVLNDPPIAARTEHYSDQLHSVTVPMAALRMRRALNRLAWSGNKRNAVVVFDRRVVSKEYGATILHTLPRCSQRQGPVSHMPELILDWLTATGSWD